MESLARITDLNLGSRWEGKAGSPLRVVVASQVPGALPFRTTPNPSRTHPGASQELFAGCDRPAPEGAQQRDEQLCPLNPGSAQSLNYLQKERPGPKESMRSILQEELLRHKSEVREPESMKMSKMNVTTSLSFIKS